MIYCIVAGKCDVQIFPVWISPAIRLSFGFVGVMTNVLAKNPHEK